MVRQDDTLARKTSGDIVNDVRRDFPDAALDGFPLGLDAEFLAGRDAHEERNFLQHDVHPLHGIGIPDNFGLRDG